MSKKRNSDLDPGMKMVERKLAYLRSFIKFSRQLNQVYDESETFDILSNFFRHHFKLDGFALLLRMRENGDMQKSVAFGTLVESYVLPASAQPFVSSVRFSANDFKPGTPEVWTQVNAHGSLLQFVMRNDQGQTIGRLCFHRAQPRTFRRREILLFKAISQYLSHHLKKIRLLREARDLAFTDSLTGIFNRRYFDQRFMREYHRAVRYQRVLSLLMIDIDHFKKYNDTHGHPTGDVALKQVASLLERNLRQADIICRYGGEEFVVLLPEIDLSNAKIVAEKLRRTLYNIPFQGEEILPEKHITISIGVASYPQTTVDAGELLRSADRALYDAKQKGRNRVVTAYGNRRSRSTPTQSQKMAEVKS
ncbi:diguanylate cyclase [candidate division KSB1 bacterium]|nr:diguanylate cyclase [candidate division KSB1 bacterium]